MEWRVQRGNRLPPARFLAIVLVVAAALAGGLPLPGLLSTSAGGSVSSAFTEDATCPSGQLHVSVADGIAGAGHSSSVILVHNNGSHSCRLMGYPKVQLLNAGGIVSAVATEAPTGFTGGLPPGAPIPSINLGGGKVASAVIEGTDVPPIGNATTCPSYPSYMITLPGMHNATKINRPIGSCSGLSVHPFVIGFNGTSPSGEVAGLVPACKVAGGGHSTIGPFVQIEALSGSFVAGMVTVAASPHSREHFQIILKPGSYLMKSKDDPSARHVTVHAGEAVSLGLFGSCYHVTSVPSTTIVPGETPSSTTSTTT